MKQTTLLVAASTNRTRRNFFALSHSTPQIGGVLCETLSTADKHRQRKINIDKWRQTSAKSDRHRQHPIQQSPQARYRTLLASTNVDKARQKQNRHPSTATRFASFHTSANGDRHRQERRPKLKLGCAGLETFAYRHDPTNNDKSRQASTKSDSDRAKRAATLAFLPQIEILGIFSLTFLVIFN